jgi:acyl-coenzyme A thioesterase PaaI-like protein
MVFFGALVTPILRPLLFITDSLEILVGFVLALPLLLYTIVSKGLRPFGKHLFSWTLLNKVPCGAAVFSVLICVFAPFSASISPRILELTSKTCKASLVERPWLRNPFRCVHACALTTLGELTGGLLVICALQNVKGARGIVVQLTTKYMKKARGTITGSSEMVLPGPGEHDMIVATSMCDSSGEVVAITEAHWKFRIPLDSKKLK